MDDEAFETFVCEYPFQGGVWLVEIKAASWEDAEARLKAMSSGVVKGRCGADIPWEPLDGGGGEQHRH